MAYKDKYKSVQINIPKNKHQDLIDWLYETCAKDERSINSFIIKILKEEKERQESNNNPNHEIV